MSAASLLLSKLESHRQKLEETFHAPDLAQAWLYLQPAEREEIIATSQQEQDGAAVQKIRTNNLQIATVLQDGADSPDSSTMPPREQACVIDINNFHVNIGFAGYGELCAATPHGRPVVFEFWDGKVRIIVYSDINNEEPTHVIEMAGAKEACRKADDNV